jgi:aspartyl/asparaginyl beta-hydroxylase (cupin superfamily)
MSVAGEGRAWEKGRCSVFDDSFIHEVRHDGPSRRVVLIVDCWHPALTNAERQFVTELMRLLNMPGGFRAKP